MRGRIAADGGAAGGQLNTPPGWGGRFPISHLDRMTRTVISPAAAFGGGKRPVTLELVSDQMPGHLTCPEWAGPMAGVGCQAKRAPRAAFPSGCLAAQTKRWAEGIRVPGPLAGGGSTTARGKLRLCPASACLRKFHWRRAGQPTPAFLPGESHGQRSLAGHSS